jgi:8-oxo-dGTP diphosphatase
MDLDGNGWARCGCGARHWGKHGAAGLFLVVEGHALLQLRPQWAHQGSTWGIPGGARDSHETVITAALREAQEETALDPGLVTVKGVHRLQHPDWRYDTVIATAVQRPYVTEQAESVQLDWIPVTDLSRWNLHPAFAASLPQITAPVVTLVVDAANVVGSRPDGWWHDRVGATQRLIARLEQIAGRMVRLRERETLLGGVEVVVEGRAKAVPDVALDSLVRVIRASGSGDDTIAVRARNLSDVVVTSDRGLRARVPRSMPVSALHAWLT